MAEPASHGPLAEPVFRSLWIATVASNIGTWVNDVGAGWLMTTIAPQPLMVALVQAATTLPLFLLAFPAGALTDIVDRRHFLIGTQLWMTVAAVVLTGVSAAGAMTPWLLVLLTFGLGIGGAMTMPAWIATVPDLVERSQLQSAIALNGVGVNVARAVGPALGGVLLSFAGPAAAFGFNAVSFLAVIVALLRWRQRATASIMPAERFLGAMRSGVRYVRHAGSLRLVLARAATVFPFGAAPWALLPLVVRHRMQAGPEVYGVVLAAVGAGAVAMAFVLPKLRRRLTRDRLVEASTLLLAIAVLGLALVTSPLPALPCALALGAAWITVMSSLQVAAQNAVPAWVRGRALAIYMVVFAGCMAAGAAGWGLLAGQVGLRSALAVAGAGTALALLFGRRFSLHTGDGEGLMPTTLWPSPEVAGEIEQDRGPVLVTIDYQIDPPRQRAFAQAMAEVRRQRLRDGACWWGLFFDAARAGQAQESFLVESWVEHLRQHGRGTVEDQTIYERARAFHIGDGPPSVRHLLALPDERRLPTD